MPAKMAQLFLAKHQLFVVLSNQNLIKIIKQRELGAGRFEPIKLAR
jgi:hypothetical protein